jgi:hypothetical protein
MTCSINFSDLEENYELVVNAMKRLRRLLLSPRIVHPNFSRILITSRLFRGDESCDWLHLFVFLLRSILPRYHTSTVCFGIGACWTTNIEIDKKTPGYATPCNQPTSPSPRKQPTRFENLRRWSSLYPVLALVIFLLRILIIMIYLILVACVSICLFRLIV